MMVIIMMIDDDDNYYYNNTTTTIKVELIMHSQPTNTQFAKSVCEQTVKIQACSCTTLSCTDIQKGTHSKQSWAKHDVALTTRKSLGKRYPKDPTSPDSYDIHVSDEVAFPWECR